MAKFYKTTERVYHNGQLLDAGSVISLPDDMRAGVCLVPCDPDGNEAKQKARRASPAPKADADDIG